MREALLRVLDQQRSRLHSCAACPVKGACVYVTPAYEPGYCLPEYKALSAGLARRLRAHPPAGSPPVFSRLEADAERLVAEIRVRRPYAAAYAEPRRARTIRQRRLSEFAPR